MEINGKVVEFDFSKTDLGDWELVMRCTKKISSEDMPTWIDFLDRVIVGGKKSLPMIVLREINKAIFDKLTEDSNPKAPTD